jgi:hypothetical protein
MKIEEEKRGRKALVLHFFLSFAFLPISDKNGIDDDARRR